MEDEKRTWAEINLDAIENNIKNIRKYVKKDTKILGVVKADAYGHGYLEIASTLLKNGADALGVACIDEAMQIRRCGILCPILVLGYTESKYAPRLVDNDITPCCYSYELASAMSKAAMKLGKRAKIHLKIDTGMGRIGLRYNEDEKINKETIDLILKIAVLPCIDIEGIFTHFAVADEKDDEYTFLQFDRFNRICNRLKENGLEIPIKHCCNSAALIRFPQMHMDMVRPGIILYGQKPSNIVDCGKLCLKSAMTFKTRISNINEIEKDESVSYGRKFKATSKTRIATIPVGYADGYSRVLSNNIQVIAGGKLCNIVGNICMDQCMIDVTSVNNINVDDEVVLFGEDNNLNLPVECLAEKIGTINYEILCLIGKRIPRIYMRKGKVIGVHNYLFDSPVIR